MFRRALGLRRGTGPPLAVCSGPSGLRVSARFAGAAIEYHHPDKRASNRLSLPFAFLSDCEGSKDEPVQVACEGKSQVVASWKNGKQAQTLRYEMPKIQALPARSKSTSTSGPGMLQSLRDAAETTSREAVRFAIDNLQLQGKTGKIVATDGRQLLIQTGFELPWEDNLLVPSSTVFASRELVGCDVTIGKTAKHVVFRIGHWTIWLPVAKEGRFPEVEEHVPSARDATATLDLPDCDVDFLTKSLKQLPSDDSFNQPVTVDLNGSVSIRAKSEERSNATELVLSNAKTSGQALRFNTNRQYLARAAKLGFRRICLTGDETPAACFDDTRVFVWALLSNGDAIKPGKCTECIESPKSRVRPTTNNLSKEPPKTMPQKRNQNNNNGKANTNGAQTSSAAEPVSVDTLIDHAESLKESLRDAATKTGNLISLLKRHRKNSKTLQSALSSIRQLQTIDA